MKTLTLNSGHTIPFLAYGTGTAHIRTKRAKTDLGADDLDRDCIDAIKTALRVGYRHLDNAEVYGTEPEVGVAIRESLAEGIIGSREDLFITSKVAEDPWHAEEAIERALKRFGDVIGGYVDLFLIHAPYVADSLADLQTAWAAMQRVYASGKARSIGVSNYEPRHVAATLATASIPPAINQIEFHPSGAARDGAPLLPALRTGGVAVSAYGALTPVIRGTAEPDNTLTPVLARLAAKYGVSPGVVCARWCVEQDVVVVTTSQKEARMREFFTDVFKFGLTDEEVREVYEAGQARWQDGSGSEFEPRILAYFEKKGTVKRGADGRIQSV